MWLGARPPPSGESGAFGPAVKGLAGARSCGFAALTLDCRSCGPGLAGHRVRPSCGQSPGQVGAASGGVGCRTVVHSPSRGLGLVVLGAPALPFGDGARAAPGCRWWGRVGRRSTRTGAARPGRARRRPSVRSRGRRCRPRQQGFADDGGPVGPVLGEGLAGPLAGDQDAAAAEAEVLPVVRLDGAAAGDQAGAGLVGLDAVAQPVRAAAASRAASAARRAAGRCAPRGPGRAVAVAERVGDRPWSGTWPGSGRPGRRRVRGR